jgi:hypothetical protein
MTVEQEKLIRLVKLLPEKEVLLAINIIGYLVPDDVATLDDIQDIEEAETAFERGEYVRHEDINWD